MFLGFLWLSIAAMAGPFLATDLTERFINDAASVSAWLPVLARSAHGHLALFGVVQILSGLTFPYSPFSLRLKKVQTAAISCGAVAMGPLMLLRALGGVAPSYDVLGVVIGALLSVAMLGLISHAVGLALKLLQST